MRSNFIRNFRVSSHALTLTCLPHSALVRRYPSFGILSRPFSMIPLPRCQTSRISLGISIYAISFLMQWFLSMHARISWRVMVCLPTLYTGSSHNQSLSQTSTCIDETSGLSWTSTSFNRSDGLKEGSASNWLKSSLRKLIASFSLETSGFSLLAELTQKVWLEAQFLRSEES